VTEQPLDVRSALRTLRRHGTWLVALVAFGVGYGALLTVTQSPRFEAKSLVLLPPSAVDAQGRFLRSMDTEALIAKSADLLELAGRAVDPPLSSRTLRDWVTTRVISADIIEVKVTAGGAAQAKLLADAVANEYVAYSNGATVLRTDSTVGVLQAQASDLEKRLTDLEAQIATGTSRLSTLDQRSAEALRESALLDSMRTEQIETSRQLSTVTGRISDARLNAELSSRGTRVLQQADVPRGEAKPRAVRNIGGGAVVGIVSGLLLALALDRNDGRLRYRDDIALAVGAPVVASLGVPRRSTASRARAMLDRWEPSVVENVALSQAFDRLGVAEEQPPVNLVLVTLAGDRAGPLIAVELAAFAATMETITVLVVASGNRITDGLRACADQSTRRVRERLFVHDLTGRSDAVPLAGAELSVAVVVADGGPLVVPTFGWRTITVLAVSSGVGSPVALGAAALACEEAGHPIRGIFVANPDPGDRSTGRMESSPSWRHEPVSLAGDLGRLPQRNGRSRDAGDPATSRVGEGAS